jgi:hypothetical protein
MHVNKCYIDIRESVNLSVLQMILSDCELHVAKFGEPVRVPFQAPDTEDACESKSSLEH